VEKLYDETTNEKEVVKDTKEEVRNTEEIKTNKSTTTTKKSNSTTTTNKESNTNNVVENKKEESAPKEEVKQKQVVEPTKGKGCPPGYTANRTNCEKRIIDRSLITRVCPKGYTKEGYQCVQGEDRSSIKASQDIMCPNANEMPLCVDSNYQNCRCNSGKAYVGYKCPNGYHHEYVSVHGLTGHYCVWNNPKKTTSMIDGCSDSSYEYSVTYGCYKYDFKPFETVYKCPNGYTLESDNKCYEN
jgi:hypothetical protein